MTEDSKLNSGRWMEEARMSSLDCWGSRQHPQLFCANEDVLTVSSDVTMVIEFFEHMNIHFEEICCSA